MKLYTEEQVNLAMRLIIEDKATFKQILELLTPIELSSDKDIENDAKKFVLSHNFLLLTNSNHLANRCFQLGAKWIKEQILNQNES
jgi:hypothetical protein